MASRTLFASARFRDAKAEFAVNEAGGSAYRLEPRAALAQYACTGTLSQTFYADAQTELTTLLNLCAEVGDPEYVAQTAVYARERGFMKDAPATLLAALVSPRQVPWESQQRANACFELAFPRVIDNGRMLRTFVQIVRSGVLGRKSLGSLPRRLIVQWLNQATDWQLWNASVGTAPSLRDVLRMVRPTPPNQQRAALYHYLAASKRDQPGALPDQIAAFDRFVAGEPADRVPDGPFELRLGLEKLTPAHWRQIAIDATWQQTRANLNTFARHGVFDDLEVVGAIAAKLRDPAQIGRAKVLPYQILAATVMVLNAPKAIRDALADAVMLATANVPTFGGQVVVCPDLSGSMHSPLTGQRGSGTTAVECIDGAALITYAVLQRNPGARVLPFTTEVHPLELTASTPLAEVSRLFHTVQGGTAISAPLTHLNANGPRPDVVLIVSDNQSWMDTRLLAGGVPPTDSAGQRLNISPVTEALRQWDLIRRGNGEAKLICVDLAPNATTQAFERRDVLNVGGFSDAVFELVARFASGEGTDRLVDTIGAVRLG
ncbi:MAG: RNA-binding protein [Dehalococcoidia bacterium]